MPKMDAKDHLIGGLLFLLIAFVLYRVFTPSDMSNMVPVEKYEELEQKYDDLSAEFISIEDPLLVLSDYFSGDGSVSFEEARSSFEKVYSVTSHY